MAQDEKSGGVFPRRFSGAVSRACDNSAAPNCFRGLIWLFLVILVPLFLGCDAIDTAEEDWVVAVGSLRIGEGALKRDMAYVSPGLDPSAFQKADLIEPFLDQLIDHYLIIEYADNSGIYISDTELEQALGQISGHANGDAFRKAMMKEYVSADEWKARVKERLLVNKVVERIMAEVPPPSYEEIKSYYESYRETFHTPERIRFCQIVTQTREEAEAVHSRLQGGEDMAELARQFSTAPEAENGGIVDWIAREDLPESMEKALFSSIGEKFSQVVKTPYGFHIFHVLDHRPEEEKGLPEVYGEIETELLARKRNAYWTEWLRGLRDRFEVKINHENLKKLRIS